ncbi:hypothetical protein KFK09_011694 [Dendrobium nobile]|uniref:Glycerol-3-phosphate acyltransferase RAM2/GPAT1-8 HAD-like domain-containing protein n=1 Tax=Dendrobium nobile TaxID=94219 RepID=A0A8T3BDD1_DENNO|nr:hypothetical protein KFK09_011694 [Dendrobium nobile]
MSVVHSPFPSIADCDLAGRDAHAVPADLDDTLLISRSSFPCFFLLAAKARSLFRAAVLFLLSTV